MNKKIRLSKSIVGEEEIIALARVIDSGYLGMGYETQSFEDEIRKFLNTNSEVICVNTGTAALHLALQALGIGHGDEVIVPSLTYVATFQAVSATGAKPVACDVNLEHGFIDVNDAKNRVNSKTKAIIPVHYGSNTDGLEGVYQFAKKFKLNVVEDAAHSFGCMRKNKKIGANGNLVCFSFDGIKNITSGEGGAIVTGDFELAEKIKDARLLGVEKDTYKRYSGERSWSFDVRNLGWRYHMSNLMAAIGREQLKKIDNFGKIRRKLAKKYVAELLLAPGLKLFNFDYENNIPHIFPLRVMGGGRDDLAELLSKEGIECGIHYQPNHLLTLYKTSYCLPNSELLGRELISLPLHPEVSRDEQNRIINLVKKFKTN